MKHLIQKYENRLAELRKAVKKNNLSEQDEARLYEAIDDLEATIEALKADDADHTLEDAFNAMKDELNTKIDALAEKVEESENAARGSENYLESKNAIHDWCEALRNSHQSSARFREIWGGHLSENGITIASGSEDAYLPAPVKSQIEDLWQKDFNWLNRLNNTGAKSLYLRKNDSTQDAETSRAKGHAKGGTKVEESLTFSAKEVTAQMIYKVISIDNMTIFEDDGALVRYIVNELYTQFLYELQRAILVGDGRANNSANKINKVESILRASTDAYVTVNTNVTTNELIEEIMNKVVSPINTDDGNGIILFMSKADKLALRRYVYATGGTPVYIGEDELKARLGVDDIIECSYLDGAGVRCIGMRPSKYATVGSLNPSFVQWENYLTNAQYYRVEAPFGGGVEGLLSAAVLKKASE